MYTKVSVSSGGLYLSLIRYGAIHAVFPIWPEEGRSFSFIVQFQEGAPGRRLVKDVDTKKLDPKALADLCVLGLDHGPDFERFLEVLQEGSVVAFPKGPTNKCPVFFQIGFLSRARTLVSKYTEFVSFGRNSKIVVRYGELGRESQVSFAFVFRPYIPLRSPRSLILLLRSLQIGVDVLDLDILPLRPHQPWTAFEKELPRNASKGKNGRPQKVEPNLLLLGIVTLETDELIGSPSTLLLETTKGIETSNVPPCLRRVASPIPLFVVPGRLLLLDAPLSQKAPSPTEPMGEKGSSAVAVEVEEKEGRVGEQKSVRASRQVFSYAGVGDSDESDEEVNEVAAIEVPVSLSSFPSQVVHPPPFADLESFHFSFFFFLGRISHLGICRTRIVHSIWERDSDIRERGWCSVGFGCVGGRRCCSRGSC